MLRVVNVVGIVHAIETPRFIFSDNEAMEIVNIFSCYTLYGIWFEFFFSHFCCNLKGVLPVIIDNIFSCSFLHVYCWFNFICLFVWTMMGARREIFLWPFDCILHINKNENIAQMSASGSGPFYFLWFDYAFGNNRSALW